MSLLGKRGGKDGSGHDEIHTRKRYTDPSTHFSNWVNQLGLEKSWLGRVAYHLDSRYKLRRLALVFIYSLVLSFFLFYDFNTMNEYSVGDVAPVDIKSPMFLTIVDEMATEAKRVEAEKALALVLDYEYEAYDDILERVHTSFRTMRNLVRQVKWPKVEDKREEALREFMQNKTLFTEQLKVEIPDYLFEWLVNKRFSQNIQNIILNIIYGWKKSLIVDMPDSSAHDPKQAVRIRKIGPLAETDREINYKLADLINMRDRAQFAQRDSRELGRLRESDRESIQKFTQLLLVPNLTINKQDYAERQKRARDGVLPVQISVKKNQVIVAKGSAIQPVHLTIFGHIERMHSMQRTDFMALFSALLLAILVGAMYFFVRSYSRHKVKIETKDFFVMGTVTLFAVLISRGWMFLIETALLDRFGDVIPQVAFWFAVPLVMGSMLVALLITSYEIVWGYVIFQSVVMGVMGDMNVQVFIVSLVSGIVAAQGVFNCTKRNDIHWAGIKTGAIAAMTAAVIFLLMNVGDANWLQSVLWVAAAGMVGGLMSSFFTMTFLPALESIFNYTTDIKLLELSSLNHPIMQEMMMKAPGTYHHAMNVGNMVDAAAKEIGSNPLLAKVMALYHDIGKVEHAQYFIENQRRGFNPHDHISPHMSKTILIAHVKDGAEIAIKNKLGKPIVDGILQHHGTTLISFFYNKALEAQDEDTTGTVEESDFRYPGPKPQFKEAALVMLADSIEATARSLEEPTSGRLNSIVENIIEGKFMDGQLDECNLSIRDLAAIKGSFKRMLQSMYHQRMDYPHMRDGKAIEVPAATGAVKTGSSRK